MVIFTHYPEEYEYLVTERTKMCKPAIVKGQKYYELSEPIAFEETEETQGATYTHLYIRKPDPWRSQVGDLDFHVSEAEYADLKKKVASESK